jgi:sugar phosphate isomerase/epimerase
MKPSVSMWSMDRMIQVQELTQLTFIQWAASKNLEYVELLSYYMEQEKNIKEVLAELEKTNIKVSCYTILSDFSTGEGILSEDFIHDLDIAEKLKAPYVRILAGDSNPDKQNAKIQIVNGIKTAANEAEKRNLKLIMENIGPYSCHSSDVKSILDLIDSPYVRLNFDTANPLLADEEPISSISKLGPYIEYVHFKDFVSDKDSNYRQIVEKDLSREQSSKTGCKMTGTTAGKGEINLPEMVKILKNKKYEGFISIEYEGTGDSMNETDSSLSYLQSLL